MTRWLASLLAAWTALAPAVVHAQFDQLHLGGQVPAATLLHCLASGEESLILNGSSGTYASTPDSAGNSITGDGDWRAKVSLVDWTPSVSNNPLAKYESVTNGRSYLVQINGGGHIVLWLSSDGTNGNFAQSTVATGLAAGATKWIRITWRASDGRTQFFTGDDGASWTQLGADVTHPITGSIADTATTLIVGAKAGDAERVTGRIYSASVRNGIDGTVVASFDADDCAAGASGGDTCTSSATSEVWTLNGAANVASRDLSCVTSETLTFTRSTVGPLCAPSAASGTSGENATNLWEPAANQACFSDSLGVRVVGSIKNELCGSETLNDSQTGCDWIADVDPATVTLDQADSPLAGTDTLADAVSDGSAVSAQRIRQSVALSTQGRYRESAWMKVGTGTATGSLEVEVDTTPTATTQTCDKSLTTSWQRFDCALDASALTFTTVIARIYPRDASEVTQTGDAHVWGAMLQGMSQFDKGAFLVPHCRSTGTTATTCAADDITIPAEPVRNAAGTWAADFTPIWTQSTAIQNFDYAKPANFFYRNAGETQWTNFDGTTRSDIAVVINAYDTHRFAIRWSGGTKSLEDITGGLRDTDAYDGSWGGTGWGFTAGYGFWKDWKIYSKPKSSNP